MFQSTTGAAPALRVLEASEYVADSAGKVETERIHSGVLYTYLGWILLPRHANPATGLFGLALLTQLHTQGMFLLPLVN